MKLSREFGAANRGCIGNFDLCEEAVAAPSNGFHKAGTFGGVAESLTNFVDRFVEPVVKIHESVCGPEFFLKFLASYHLAGVLKQHRQDLEWLCLKPNSQAALAQFASAKIQFENSKTERPAKLRVFLHREEISVGRKCTTPQSLLEHEAGTFSFKSFIKK
jgi:hypothetical protein